MFEYHLFQWLLFFYFYCFVGWVWESGYVSFKKRKWVNRGFMHGPFLPIYGSGAITVLVTTIPVKDNLFLIFICGMIGATVLEYFTGVIMEKLFHVRYWDYTGKFLNVNGHICLLSSLAWGAFSIGMIKVIHRPIEALILAIPYELAETICLLLTVGIAIDMTQSFNEAMDLKELLQNLTESNEEIKRIRKRIDGIVTVVDSQRKELLLKATESKEAWEIKLNELRNRYEIIQEEKKEKSLDKKISKSIRVRLRIEDQRFNRTKALTSLSEHVNTYLDAMKERVVGEKRVDETEQLNRLEKLRTELDGLKESIRKQTNKLRNRSDKSYTRSLKLLRRNPNAVSIKYAEALKEMQSLDNEEK